MQTNRITFTNSPRPAYNNVQMTHMYSLIKHFCMETIERTWSFCLQEPHSTRDVTKPPWHPVANTVPGINVREQPASRQPGRAAGAMCTPILPPSTPWCCESPPAANSGSRKHCAQCKYLLSRANVQTPPACPFTCTIFFFLKSDFTCTVCQETKLEIGRRI